MGCCLRSRGHQAASHQHAQQASPEVFAGPRPPAPCHGPATGDFHSDEQPLLGSKPPPRIRISWPESTPPARLPGEPLLTLCPRGPSPDPMPASFLPGPRWVLPPTHTHTPGE